MRKRFLLYIFITCISLISCVSNKVENQISNYDDEEILLSFAGDIMAHTRVTLQKDFNIIYDDIKKYLLDSDFAFANIETPVFDAEDYQNYPEFNAKNEYIYACIEAGFNIFSLANNHTNDQELEGMMATRSFFEKLENDSKNSIREIYFSGIRKTDNDFYTIKKIKKGNWDFIYLSVTEILNRFISYKYIDYVDPSKKARDGFLKVIKTVKEENPNSIFILSFHCGEKEYLQTVPKKQKEFYKSMIDSGVDILWINHAHVPKTMEILNDKNNIPNKIIFYGQGNTISGQRFNPNFSNPNDEWDLTGDGFITQVKLKKKGDSYEILKINPIGITSFIRNDKKIVIKELNKDFLSELKTENNTKWYNYIEKRIKIISNINNNIIWNKNISIPNIQ